jgi:5-methylcytosine-specific restriction endonuclease McrA
VYGKDDPLFWDVDNHQSLCVTCHAKKTAKERINIRTRKE